MSNEQFLQYISSGYHHVVGFVQPGMFPVLTCLDEFQEQEGLAGDVAEIGVHHGRFFLALHNCLRGSERSVAIDVFDDQKANIDYSGHGNLVAFKENLQGHSQSPERCTIVARDSIAMCDIDIRSAIEGGLRTRLFSVDGGHTPEHVLHDLMLAVSVSHAYGVIFVDDYYNPHWPGVHIGVTRLFSSGFPTFVPFGYCRDKLMLTSITWQKAYFYLLSNRFKAEPHMKVVNMFGYSVAVV